MDNCYGLPPKGLIKSHNGNGSKLVSLSANEMQGCMHTKQVTGLHINCERRLFLMHRDTTIYILKTKVAPDFLGAYHVLFSLSKLFYVDSFMLV